jgi:hypothetical protein
MDMNVRLILSISSFGVLVGVGSVVGMIRMGQEGPAWLVLGLIAATWIALQAPGRAFVHGFVAGLIAGLVAPVIQILFFPSYLAHNPIAAESFRQLPAGASPRLFVLLVTPVLSLLSGLTLGTLAWAARKALRRKVTARA